MLVYGLGAHCEQGSSQGIATSGFRAHGEHHAGQGALVANSIAFTGLHIHGLYPLDLLAEIREPSLEDACDSVVTGH